jgi:hypothetical protein
MNKYLIEIKDGDNKGVQLIAYKKWQEWYYYEINNKKHNSQKESIISEHDCKVIKIL